MNSGYKSRTGVQLEVVADVIHNLRIPKNPEQIPCVSLESQNRMMNFLGPCQSFKWLRNYVFVLFLDFLCQKVSGSGFYALELCFLEPNSNFFKLAY